jgi:murein DD-endopeptidase MepM/ murein hydrolase activator NlpD
MEVSAPAWAQAKKPSKEEIRKLEQQQSALEAKRQALRAKRIEKERQARLMTQQFLSNQKKMKRAQWSLQSQRQVLLQNRTELSLLESDIDRINVETVRLEQEVAQRIKRLYMGGRVNVLQMLFESNDMAGFLDRIYYKRKLVENDRAVLAALREKSLQLRQQTQLLAQQQRVVDQNIKNIHNLKQNYEIRVAKDQRLRDLYKKDAALYEHAENELLNESNKIEQELSRLIPGRKQDVLARQSKPFIWPAKGRISSGFGFRVHPIHRTRKMHTGLDVAKATGAPIKAADGGEVIYSGWRGGYGYAVMINHGNKNGKNMVTLYGHCSRLLVKKGQTVKQGQVIAKVGSTGRSTGPHLHFEVRINGKPVNPANYLP